MNPIAPYRWEARYATGRLLQLDVDGWHTSREIDRGRLRSLCLYGHPASPILLPMPCPAVPVDEVLVRATTELTTQDVGSLTAQRWTFLGVRYGIQAWILQIDPAGHLITRTLALPPGAPLDPMHCDRCRPGGTLAADWRL